MKNKAIPFLMTGMIIIILNTVLDLTADFPHAVKICLTILSLILIAIGVFIVAKSKKEK